MYEDEVYAEKLARGFNEDHRQSSCDEVPF